MRNNIHHFFQPKPSNHLISETYFEPQFPSLRPPLLGSEQQPTPLTTDTAREQKWLDNNWTVLQNFAPMIITEASRSLYKSFSTHRFLKLSEIWGASSCKPVITVARHAPSQQCELIKSCYNVTPAAIGRELRPGSRWTNESPGHKGSSLCSERLDGGDLINRRKLV